LAPDNGVLTLVLARASAEAIVRVTNRSLFLHPVSRTFHGRDIFAPVAAHLAGNTPLARIGEPVEPSRVRRFPLRRPREIGSCELAGCIVWIDRFGNLMTNISEHRFRRFYRRCGGGVAVRIGGERIIGLSESYGQAAAGAALAIFASRGYLEISVNGGRADSRFQVGPGAPVSICAGMRQ
jgi:S-adenosylmethionine hydrolase